MVLKTGSKKGYEACIGCGVCLLSCPVWHRTQQMSFTRKARAKAVQGGAGCEEIAHAIDACLLCGACEAACPEGIGLADLNIRQRQELNGLRTTRPHWYPRENFQMDIPAPVAKASTLLLAGDFLGRDRRVIDSVIAALGGEGKAVLAHDDGQDIGRAMEAGIKVPARRVESFLSSLRAAGRTLIVTEGLLHRPLRRWLKGKKIIGLGEALLSRGSIRRHLGPGDLYIIEGRGYHADHSRLAVFYDRLRRQTGCYTNLDLQRTAFSTGASSLQGRYDMSAAGCVENARRILRGKRVDRIVVEDLADFGPFGHACDLPVVHLGQLGSMETLR